MTAKRPVSSIKKRSHLDEVLQLALDRTRGNRNQIAAGEARRRLKILHAICDEHYKTGSRDFSYSVLGPSFISQGGLKGMRTFRQPYRMLVDAWSEFADGHTRARKMIRADEETADTVDYIDRHFSACGQLPSWEALCNDGITVYRRESMSGSGKSMFINRCMELWRHNWLLKISPIIETACEQHWDAFDRMLALNGKDPIFFRLDEDELPVVVGPMTNLLQAYAGSIGRAVPFVEGAERLSELGILGDSIEILKLASAGTAVQLGGRDQSGPILISRARKTIPLRSANTSILMDNPHAK